MHVRALIILPAVMLVTTAAYFAGAYHFGHSTPANTKPVLYYVDPMHPDYKSSKPGLAPDCGMPLVPVFADEPQATGTAGHGASAESITIDPRIARSLGIRVVEARATRESRVVQAVGRVLPEDTFTYKVNAGVDGFIRETWADSIGMRVRKNQKLATYYAPDFLAAASGYLAANERIPGAVTKEGARSLQNYTDRLRNLGMSDQQIKQISDNKQLPESIDIVSPADGFILGRNITAGQHFEHGMEFYRVADLRRVWVVAEIDEQDVAAAHPGDAAVIDIQGQNLHLAARISESLPQSASGGTTVKVRLEVENPNALLLPDMLVDVRFPLRIAASVTVPSDALIDSGSTARVYVQNSDNGFEPRAVQLGWRTADTVEIVRGLNKGERIAVGAAFLMDSESRLRSLPTAEIHAPMTRKMAHPPGRSEHGGSDD